VLSRQKRQQRQPPQTAAHGHFTWPERAWFAKFTAAFAATAMALVPIAMCGFVTPTT
jgi:hypothetical protein